MVCTGSPFSFATSASAAALPMLVVGTTVVVRRFWRIEAASMPPQPAMPMYLWYTQATGLTEGEAANRDLVVMELDDIKVVLSAEQGLQAIEPA